MNKLKILALGNEFIKEDSFAKELSKLINISGKNKIINIKDSFQFLEEIQSKEKFIILDVVQNLKQVKLLQISDLDNNSILSAHDMDASFFLQLLKPNVRIIGLPQNPKKEEISKIISDVEKLIS
jgi:Ni,Fe-hydrogenase maturation factor